MTVPLPTFLRSQSSLSQARSDSAASYVEDSEPEREERRVKAKRKSSSREKSCPKPVVHPVDEIIELTDSEPSRPPTPELYFQTIASKTPVIIEVSDSSEISAHDDFPSVRSRNAVTYRFLSDTSLTINDEESLPSVRNILGLHKGDPQVSDRAPEAPPEATPVQSLPPSPLLPTQPAPLLTATTSTQGSGDNDEDYGACLKLDRFAYAAPKVLRKTASKTPSLSESGSRTPEIRAGAPKAKRIPTHRFTEDFSDAELSQILICVSCELAWTARKTVKEKMKHIQTCAKKNGLNDDTIRVLLRKELDSLPPAASASKLPAEPSPPAVPDTLLEGVLRDAQKKKPGRRPQVLQTVKSITETRDNILDKARILLQDGRNAPLPGPSNSATSASASTLSMTMDMPPPATQAFGKSSLAVRDAPARAYAADTNLAFGIGTLGVAQTSRIQAGIVQMGADIATHSDVSPLTQVFSDSALGTIMAAEDPTPEDETPPATQVFACSKLTNTFSVGAIGRVVTANDDAMDELMSLHDTSSDEWSKSSPARPTLPLSSPSPNANRRRRSPSLASLAESSPHASLPNATFPSPVRDMSPVGDDMLQARLTYEPASRVQNSYHYEWNDSHQTESHEDGGSACLHYDPQEHDGASLHYIPEDGVASPPPSLAPVQPSPPLGSRISAAIAEDPVPGSSTSAGIPDTSQPPTKRKGKRKKAAEVESDAEAPVGKDISQEELNAKLKEAILKDEALHLRVLRYEPLPFDVFMKLATDLSIPIRGSGLKLKVRAFLDQKAIHFYGAEPSKSRTRRTRYP